MLVSLVFSQEAAQIALFLTLATILAIKESSDTLMNGVFSLLLAVSAMVLGGCWISSVIMSGGMAKG